MIKFDTEKSEVPMLPPENEETFYYVQMLIEGKEEVPGTQDSWIEVCFFFHSWWLFWIAATSIATKHGTDKYHVSNIGKNLSQKYLGNFFLA